MTKTKKIETKKSISEIFKLFHKEKDVVILESSLVNNLGRYSILGRKPYHKIVKIKNKVFINEQETLVDFDNYVKDYFRNNFEENNTTLPIINGAIGYFSYDYNSMKNSAIPESILIFYDQFIIQDHKSDNIYLVCNEKTQCINDAALELKSTIKSSKASNINKKNSKLQFDFEKTEYENAIKNIINHIIEGDIYIANMTQRLFIESTMKPYELHEILRKDNPSPFSAYLNYDDFQVICASPERFIKVNNKEIVTRPIKGTRKRGNNIDEDELLKKELENSDKDKSELLMIVDLERNDLSKICEAGSVKVENLFSIESYATVHHLVAEVKGHLKNQVDFIDIVNATFPGGSITGAPKRRAMEIIDNLEINNRGLYTGSIGYFSLNGDCDMNIVIRTAVFQDNIFTIGVGGGITYESDPQMEYEETIQKVKAFFDAFKK